MSNIEIIAEIGVNHNGDPQQALALISAAKDAGCDTVKFQLFHGDRYPHLQLSVEQLRWLKHRAEHLGLKFLCTPDDIDDAIALKRMGCDRIKIGSSNVTNIPLLRQVAHLDMDVILSTGACLLGDIIEALRMLSPPMGAIIRDRVVMHCVSAYPAPTSELNLIMLHVLNCADRVYCIGYSDHTMGFDYQSALVALGLGARVIEKHFTAAHWMKGPDHKMSADLHEMKTYVGQLRRYAAALGDGVKRVQPCEQKNREEYLKFVEAQRVNPYDGVIGVPGQKLESGFG